ncbi:hypothetical protein K470DRAFT_243317 [Piedraia hortae CBS 480.64]|uniref:PX domain-containing protein n=1 Tax=Piedraia hortae CBS 480.64 TaxID=1314780 RepID=A0A6A7C4B7_9PEZI|nr:hypothetical protein K470DRAFT_243317 [Piedraia hortae CBS 480.64]
MWDDEDNNPYGSFQRRSSESSEDEQHSPDVLQSTSLDDTDGGAPAETIAPREGGYDSRIQQILHEQPDVAIQIVHAGKNSEGSGGYIVYTIRTGDIEVRRRYSEFASLRLTLVHLHPTLIVPPIPEKHSIVDYAAKPTRAKEDVAIIELRQRMLAIFLNRCRRMREIRDDGVWWRFLDPNVSWSEVLQSHPASSVPKNNLKAPPLDPSSPTSAHQWLPVPSQSAKLRSSSSTSASGTPTSPPAIASLPSAAAHSQPQIQYARFPPSAEDLSESELDPYFSSFERSSKDLETLLAGPMEKVNTRLLRHLYQLGEDLMDLGARYNAFSLSEQSPTVAQAIEKAGQSCDFTYISLRDLSSGLSAGFAEPMRENAQFAGVVRGVLKFRVLKRVQEEMTRDELERKRASLDQLERSEKEAKRIEQFMATSGVQSSPTDQQVPQDLSPVSPSVPTDDTTPRKRSISSGVATKLLGRLSGFTQALQGVTDQDPERARRDALGKTKESLSHLEQALEVAQVDVKQTSAGVLQDLSRFQTQKEDDLRSYMLNFAKCHLEWSKRNLQAWSEARDDIAKI